MKKGFHLGQREFEALLDLLSDDREEAGKVYERVRLGLLRFFRYQGCPDAEDLVDETFNRVASRTHKFDPSLARNPERFFYGFAALIAKEHRRKMARQVPLDGSETGVHADHPPFTEAELRRLQDCLEELDTADQQLITEYHSPNRETRIEIRQKLCERLHCSSGALYARVSRIRGRLKRCMENCGRNKM